MNDIPYIPLDRLPSLDDFATVVASADLPCSCDTEIREQVIIDGVMKMCAGCAARQILNGVASLSERLQKVM